MSETDTQTGARQRELPTSMAGVGAELALAPDVQLAVDASEGTVTAAQVRVLQRTICAKFSPEQLMLFLTICRRKRVDPFTQAYGFPNSDGGLAFGLRIDGMRDLAMRTGEYLKREVEPLLAPDGPDKGKMVGAVARIWRQGMEGPVVEEALFSEYKKPGFGWDKYPETMVKKCAEAKALRAAFADALSGVYEPAELRPSEEDEA